MQDLKGKRVLFIGIGFYDYDEHITRKIENLGGVVDYKRYYPTLSFIQKVFKKIIRNEDEIIENYFKNLFRNLKDYYDYVLVIKGDKIPDFFYKAIREKYKCPFILYQWDSIRRVDNFDNTKKYFDRILTFDRLDSIKYGYEFRPLFYKDIYLSNDENKKEYDLFFSGFLHSDRYEIVKNILKNYKNIKFKYHLFSHWFYFLIQQINRFKKSKTFYNKNLISFKSISELENKEFMAKSKAILDIHHPEQSGLTIRTIESLAIGNKIITTNEDIKNYEFYNPKNILIIDRDNIQIPLYFFEKNESFTNEDKKIYSLEQWVLDVFEMKRRYKNDLK